MIITISVWCDRQKREHSADLEIYENGTYKIVNSACMQEYGKTFGLMMPCAKKILSPKEQRNILYSIAKGAGQKVKTSPNITQTFKDLYNFFKEDLPIQRYFINIAIAEITGLEKEGMPILEQLIQEYDTNIHYYISYELESIKERIRNRIKIPRKLSITSSLIKHIRNNNNEKIEQLIKTIVREKITIAIPVILLNIKLNNPLNELYIDAVLKLADEKTIRQHLYSENIQLAESILLVLEKINPPDLVELATDIIIKRNDKSSNIEKITTNIIEAKATEKHWDILIEAFKHTNSPQIYTSIYKTLIKIKQKRYEPTLLEYLKTIPPSFKDKQRQTIHIIIATNIQKYTEDPLQTLSDFEPNDEQIEHIFITLYYELAHNPIIQKQVLKTLLEKIKEDPTQKYKPQTIEFLTKITSENNQQESVE